MAQNVFIVGLPRSRTAWFAAYLSAYPDVHCWHEGLKGCHDPSEFHNKMQPLGPHPAELIVGNSDSMLMHFNIDAVFPDAPVIVIKRPFEQVLASVGQLFGNVSTEMMQALSAAHERLECHPGLHVDYEGIDAMMELIHDHLHIPYRRDIHMLYQPLNIQTMDLNPDARALKWLPFAQ